MKKFIKYDWIVSSDIENTIKWHYLMWFYLVDLEIDNKVDLCGNGRICFLVPDGATDRNLMALRTINQSVVNKRFRKTFYVKDQLIADTVVEFARQNAKKYNITLLDIEVKDSLDATI